MNTNLFLPLLIEYGPNQFQATIVWLENHPFELRKGESHANL